MAAVAGTEPIFIMKFSLNYTNMPKYQAKIEGYEGNLKIRKSDQFMLANYISLIIPPKSI